MNYRSTRFLIAAALIAGTVFAADATWTGKITDAMCDKDHSMMSSGNKQPEARECTLTCVKNGSKFVFVASDGKVYQLSNQDLPDLKTYAGKDVQLTGQLQSDGKTIKADQLKASN